MVPVSIDSIQAISPLCARVSSASLAAACSASFLLRPSDAESLRPSCQTSTSKVLLCSGPDHCRTRYSAMPSPRCWSHSCSADLWSGVRGLRCHPPARGRADCGEEKRSGRQAAVEIDRAYDGFVRVGKQPFFSRGRRSFPRRARGAGKRRASGVAPPRGSTRRSRAAASPSRDGRRPS